MALAAVTLLSVQGCDPAPPAEAATRVPHDVSFAQARSVFGNYVADSNADAAAGDQVQGLDIVADAQWAVVSGQYTALSSAGTPVPQYTYTAPVFYVPALDSFPHWFVVKAARHQTGSKVTSPGMLLLFEQAKAGQPWTLDGSARLTQPMPELATDSDGYAVDASTNDSALLVTTGAVGASQAALVDDGPASPASAAVASGPLTTGLYTAQSAQAAADKAHGWTYQWLLEGTSFEQFQLRTADGGALVFYGMYLETTTEYPNLVAGAPIPVPAAFKPLLAAPTEVGYHAVYANWTYEFAAVDPPTTAKGAKVQVVADTGGPSFGHAY